MRLKYFTVTRFSNVFTLLLFTKVDARHQHMFQQLADALGLEMNNIEDHILADEKVATCMSSAKVTTIWATSLQNQQNDVRTQRRLRSAWASAQSYQSLRITLNG